jgi:3-dehydroquinate synthetase
VRVKAAVVARDERESGERKTLNLGHTFAHAIEHVAGYGTIPHGVAVGVGLCLALRASQAAGLLKSSETLPRVERLLLALGLCATLGELREAYRHALPAHDLVQAMRLDKKSAEGSPRFVLVREPGALVWDQGLDRGQLAALLA